MADEAIQEGQEEVSLESVAQDEFTRAIAFLQQRCATCWFIYGGESTGHQGSECPEESGEAAAEINRVTRAWKEVIKWERFIACFRCGFPVAICPRFQRRANGQFNMVRGRQCGSIKGFRVGNPGSMIRLQGLAYRYGPDTYVKRFLGWMAAAGIDRMDKVAVGRWLSKRVKWEG